MKVRDYIVHTINSNWIHPKLFIVKQSSGTDQDDGVFDAFEDIRVPVPRVADAYFLAGEDWFALDAAEIDLENRPVVNLIQGIRHADPTNRIFNCLSRPALRLCVSGAVAQAIQPYANGPIRVMPTGVYTPPPSPAAEPTVDVFISGYKAPGLAQGIAAGMPAGLRVDVVYEQLPREAFLSRAAAARVVILLPLEQEGFFLPPLETMSWGAAIVTTDSLGSRDYCRDGVNCLVAAREPAALVEASCRLLQDPVLSFRLGIAGRATATTRSLSAERHAYLEALRDYLPGHRSN